MKRASAIFLILTALSLSAYAQSGKSSGAKIELEFEGKAADGPMGVGLFLGQPTGITFEMDLAPASWVDFKAAWNFGGAGFSIILQGNYEYAFLNKLAINELALSPFAGVGAAVNLYDGGVAVGARIPAGVSHRMRNIPIELFLELGLDVYLLPAFDIGISGGLGARYRF